MTKTNFSKAEEALNETLQKINRDKLLEMADQASGNHSIPLPEVQNRRTIAAAFERDIKRLYYQNKDAFKLMDIKKKTLDAWFKDPASLPEPEWAKLIQAKAAVDEYLKKYPFKTGTDDQIVEAERTKHLNKRFNVNDKWLPLR